MLLLDIHATGFNCLHCMNPECLFIETGVNISSGKKIDSNNLKMGKGMSLGVKMSGHRGVSVVYNGMSVSVHSLSQCLFCFGQHIEFYI